MKLLIGSDIKHHCYYSWPTSQPTVRSSVRPSVRPTDRPTDQTTMSALHHQLRTQLRRLRPNVKLDSLLIISTSSLFIQFQYINFCYFFLLQFLSLSLQSSDCLHQFVLFMLPHILFFFVHFPNHIQFVLKLVWAKLSHSIQFNSIQIAFRRKNCRWFRCVRTEKWL